MATAVSKKGTGDVQPATRGAIIDAFKQLVFQVPEAPEGDITDILGGIIAADNLQALDRPDKLLASKDLVDVPLRVEDLKRAPSNKDSLTGFYLRVYGTRLDTGEMFWHTAGGEQAVAFLSKLYVLGSLPAHIVYRSVDVGDGNKAINAKLAGPDDRRVVNG